MIIRECTEADFPDITELLKEFQEEALADYGMKCETEPIAKAIKANYKNGLVVEVDNKVVGMIAGTIMQYPLQEAKLFQEMVWFVSKSHRAHGMKLLKALETKCAEEGIFAIVMVRLNNAMSEKLDRIYKMNDYREIETHYLKVIK